MPSRLKRYYGQRDLHFITFSCYEQRPLLDTPLARDVFVKVLAVMRLRYKFRLVGYVVMPDHVHLLISEPEIGNPSIVLKALKHRVSAELRERRRADQRSPQRSSTISRVKILPRFWQPRFYDFNVYTSAKKKEKLEYMHTNPLTRKLVEHAGDWIWSSYLFYETGRQGIIPIDPVD